MSWTLHIGTPVKASGVKAALMKAATEAGPLNPLVVEAATALARTFGQDALVRLSLYGDEEQGSVSVNVQTAE
jgi:hypothetical protein